MNAVNWLYLVFGLALVNWAVGVAVLKSFLAGTPVINSTIDLQNFAAMVRRHMLQAVLQIALLGAGLILGLYLLARHKVGLPQIIVLNGLIFAAGMLGKPLEERARSLKVLDPLLEERYRAICTTWVKKPFPDF
jgi:hypothetical protein